MGVEAKIDSLKLVPTMVPVSEEVLKQQLEEVLEVLHYANNHAPNRETPLGYAGCHNPDCMNNYLGK